MKFESRMEVGESESMASDGAGRQRRGLLVRAALALGAAALPRLALAEANPEIRAAESIHQEPLFKAARPRVYAALTSSRLFDQVIQLSGVMKADALAKMKAPTRLSTHVGGPITLFGGYVVGRQIELVPDQLLIQAWRAQSWPPGVYSIARFELNDAAGGTRLVFDHTGFPPGTAAHLASGWHEHYWDPIAKLLA